MTMAWTIEFDRGTLKIDAPQTSPEALEAIPHLPPLCWDDRVSAFRASAISYRRLLVALTRAKIPFDDKARQYGQLDLKFQYERKPFPYQQEAVEAWDKNGGSGVVVLPTGAGKSFVAYLIMALKNRPTLVVTPTIDLVVQWKRNLEAAFGVEVGMLGGGANEILPMTVTTYDSAYIHMERLGNQFGLLVFDEVHHLPSETYCLSAFQSIAPFRLGLTATPEREAPHTYAELIGPIVYQRSIRDMTGETLANYECVNYEVSLQEDERQAYEEARACYLSFIRENKIRVGTPTGWGEFLRLSSRSTEGRAALRAHRLQREITQHCREKLALLEKLLAFHRNDRTIVFTADNATVYRLSREYLLPAMTHQTPAKERHAILEGFNSGKFPVIVTSKVLNEGVDIPAANVAIVLSGSGSVREHVQRLGRILRAAKEKTATLYEIVAQNTMEEFTSSRRRKHDAF